MHVKRRILVFLCLLSLASPVSAKQFKTLASWYGAAFHGRRTASGRRFSAGGRTAAHRTLKFGTRLRVTNLKTKKSVVVTVTDRGPFKKGRGIDLSKGAAKAIGMLRSGTALVLVEVLKSGTSGSNT
jgi:rare lipoprotein A